MAFCNAESVRPVAQQSSAAVERPAYFVVGAGPAIVMLHSSLSSKSQWTALAERLASRFRVIALDLCGYGDNTVLAAEASFTLDAEMGVITITDPDRINPWIEAFLDICVERETIHRAHAKMASIEVRTLT